MLTYLLCTNLTCHRECNGIHNSIVLSNVLKNQAPLQSKLARLRNVEDNLAFKCFCIIPLWEVEHMFSGWSIGDKLVLSYFLSLTSFINMLIDARSEGKGKIKKQIKQHIMI